MSTKDLKEIRQLKSEGNKITMARNKFVAELEVARKKECIELLQELRD